MLAEWWTLVMQNSDLIGCPPELEGIPWPSHDYSRPAEAVAYPMLLPGRKRLMQAREQSCTFA